MVSTLSIDHLWCDRAKWVWSHTNREREKKLFYIVVLGMCNFNLAENPMKIGWLVPEIQAFESFAKQRKFFLLIGYILKSTFTSFNSILID